MNSCPPRYYLSKGELEIGVANFWVEGTQKSWCQMDSMTVGIEFRIR